MYVPLHCHSFYSLLDGVSSPERMAERTVQIGAGSCAITDHGSISGAVAFTKAMKGACGKCGKTKDAHGDFSEMTCKEFSPSELKPIIGSEFYITHQASTVKTKQNNVSHMVILAQNLEGWRQMIKMTSEANHPDNFYYKPRLDLEQLSNYTGNLISFSGHPGSHLSECLFNDGYFSSKTPDEARTFLRDDWEEYGTHMAKTLEGLFGRGKFFIEIQLIEPSPVAIVTAECLRKISRVTGIHCVATPDAHYATKDDAVLQRLLLCKNLKKTIPGIETALKRGEDVALGTFFQTDNYHIPSFEEMGAIHTKEELNNTLLINEMCEKYSVLGKPVLPEFKTDMGVDEHLRHLCREGWKKKIEGRIDKSEYPVYADRVKHELEVLQGAGLSSYFLIVEDIFRHGKSKDWVMGYGRGSVGGSLVAYLLDITKANPIQYDLIFERFYNAGRNTADRVSMPDIDIDVPSKKRDEMISYIREKYGDAHVSQMISFQTLKGRGAISEVCRSFDKMTHDEIKYITQFIPEPAKISDELQEMKDEEGDASIIKWTVQNNPRMKEFCHYEENKLVGPMAEMFDLAIRLEGTKTAQSKHPAGIVITPMPVGELCPLVLDTKTNARVAGFEMYDLEDIGGLKFDILGVAVCDKIMGVRDILRKGHR